MAKYGEEKYGYDWEEDYYESDDFLIQEELLKYNTPTSEYNYD